MGKFDEKLYVSLTYPLLLQSCGGATNRNTEKNQEKTRLNMNNQEITRLNMNIKEITRFVCNTQENQY